MCEPSTPSPPRAVASVIASMALIAMGNGVLLAYIPVKLDAAGFAPWVAGAAVAAMAAGGLAGCLRTGALVQRVGHARVFSSLAALVSLSVLPVALGAEPAAWIAGRALYGFAVTGLFIVTQSWLNDACEDAWRGRVIALFYAAYVISIGVGAFVAGRVSLEGNLAPLLSIAFATLAVLPAGLTRLRTPPPPESVALDFARVWRVSPAGLVGMLAVGGLTMTVQGFAPIYAAAMGYPKASIGWLMLLMQLGMLAVQFPLGALSDRVDRRLVLVLAAGIVVLAAGVASRLGAPGLAVLVPVFAIWAGATESIYSVANAHAHDRADPRAYVSVSSTLMVAWSLSAFVLPTVATVLTRHVGPEAFMYVTIGAAAAYGAFVVARVARREPVPPAEQEPFQAGTAQAPYSPEIAPHAAADGGGSGGE